jgi:hypothetical protein
MDAGFDAKLRAAVSAGWRVLVAEVVFLTLVWLIYLRIMSAHPAPMLALFGPDVSWSTVALVTLLAVAVFKVAIWIEAGVVLWMWTWGSLLRRRGAPDARGRTERGEPPAERAPQVADRPAL